MSIPTFVPPMEEMGGITPSMWRYTPILPLVFGMELSYMEQVAKLAQKVNEVIESDNAQATNIEKLYHAFTELEAAALGKGEGWITTSMIADKCITDSKLGDKAVKGNHLADGIVGNTHLVNGCVTADKLGAQSVTSDKLGDKSVMAKHLHDAIVRTVNLVNGCVTSDKLADQSVENWHIAVGAVGASQIGARAVHESNIGDGAIVNRTIANGAITPEKLNPAMLDSWNHVVQTMLELTGDRGSYTFNDIRVLKSMEFQPDSDVNFGGNVIHDLGNPMSPQDGANKRYVDSKVANHYPAYAYERFCENIARMSVNPIEPLNIPTYDGSGQLTHPCVRYFENEWAGQKWWMAYTPYPNSALDKENPCVAYSDDGIHWSTNGIPNPLDEPLWVNGEQASMNSDPHLLMLGRAMEVVWRTNYWSNAGDNANQMVIYSRTSIDGVNWSPKQEVYRVNNGDKVVVCPVILYEDDVYKMWIVDDYTLRYFEKRNGNDWVYMRGIHVENLEHPGYLLWHFDINHTEAGYEFVGCYRPVDDDHGNKYIYYAHSDDNVTYTAPVLILTPGLEGSFDALQLYRPSIVRVGNMVRVYYGAQDARYAWHVGMIEAPDPYLFNAVLKAGELVKSIEDRVYKVEQMLGGGTTDNVTVVNSFDESPWLEGYWNPGENGALVTYNNMHRSQLVPLSSLMNDGQMVYNTVTSLEPMFPVLRVNYFDRNKRWVGFDTGAVISDTTGEQLPTPINWPSGAVYYAISANTSDKSMIVFSLT